MSGISIRLLGVAVFLVAALYFWVGRTYSAPFGDVLGPAAFPVLVAVPTMLLAASLVAFPSGEVTWPPAGRIARQAAGLGVLVLYALLLKPLGFPLSTFGLIAGLAVTMGGPVPTSLALGAGMSLTLWVLFDRVLGLPLAFLGPWLGG